MSRSVEWMVAVRASTSRFDEGQGAGSEPTSVSGMGRWPLLRGRQARPGGSWWSVRRGEQGDEDSSVGVRPYSPVPLGVAMLMG